jgi:hypothetical protein
LLGNGVIFALASMVCRNFFSEKGRNISIFSKRRRNEDASCCCVGRESSEVKSGGKKMSESSDMINKEYDAQGMNQTQQHIVDPDHPVPNHLSAKTKLRVFLEEEDLETLQKRAKYAGIESGPDMEKNELIDKLIQYHINHLN